MNQVCSVDGCGNPSRKAGLCNKHHLRRWRYGDTSVTKKAANGAGLRFINEVALHHAADECLIWPFRLGANGYARLNVGGRSFGAHRMVCELANGAPALPELEAAHTCGNGHLGCVNPSHLRWATRTQNMRDKAAHGTQTRGSTHPVSKISESDVQKIRGLRGLMSQRQIAAMFAISAGHVSDIQTGKSRTRP